MGILLDSALEGFNPEQVNLFSWREAKAFSCRESSSIGLGWLGSVLKFDLSIFTP
jgi:hypothetical protein